MLDDFLETMQLQVLQSLWVKFEQELIWPARDFVPQQECLDGGAGRGRTANWRRPAPTLGPSVRLTVHRLGNNE